MAHHLAAPLGHLVRFERQGAGFERVIGVVLHRRVDLLHRACGLFQRARLLLGAGRQISVAGSDLPRREVDGIGPRLDAQHQLSQAFDGSVGVLAQMREGPLVIRGYLLGQVTAGDRVEYVRDIRQTAGDRVHERIHPFGELQEEA